MSNHNPMRECLVRKSSLKSGYEPITANKMGFDNSAVMDKIDLLIDAKLEERLESMMKPLQQKISELETENRRMKIALRFLESELKDCVRTKNNHHNSRSLYADPKRRNFPVKTNDLPQSDPKKLRLLDDKPINSECKNGKLLAEYTKLPESIDKIRIANEENKTAPTSKPQDQLNSLSKPVATSSSNKTLTNQLYLAVPSANKSTDIIPLVLQSKRKECGSPLISSTQVTSSMGETPRTESPITAVPSLPLTSSSRNSSTSQEKTVTPGVLTNGSTVLSDISMDDDDEIVVVPPPPKTPPAVIDLSEEGDCDMTNYEVSEILPGPECHMHPQVPPSLPFMVSSEEQIPPPTLKARTGRGKDGKKAVVLRMESKISGIQNLQYRVFSHFENPSEAVKDRRWKQLTCIKVQSGRVCECTLTHLMEKVRYHFVVCLVQGNNRSKFSNCAPHVY